LGHLSLLIPDAYSIVLERSQHEFPFKEGNTIFLSCGWPNAQAAQEGNKKKFSFHSIW
jgi:hypothetical protein